MPRFRKKPVEVDALPWTGFNVEELAKWAANVDFAHRKARGEMPTLNVELPIDIILSGSPAVPPRVEIRSKEGVMTASVGDYIICGIQGEFSPCKPDIFEASYDRVREE